MVDRANDIRSGQILEHNGDLFLIVSVMHTQPGKGGAYIQAEMKNIKTGAKYYERFRSDAIVKRVILDGEEYVYLFIENGEIVHLMHPNNYEQITVDLSLFGEKKVYLLDNIKVKVVTYKNKVISVQVPDYVALDVKETESLIKGQTANPSYKPAILENGVRVVVPQFIKEHDKILVYTPDNSYYERLKE